MIICDLMLWLVWDCGNSRSTRPVAVGFSLGKVCKIFLKLFSPYFYLSPTLYACVYPTPCVCVNTFPTLCINVFPTLSACISVWWCIPILCACMCPTPHPVCLCYPSFYVCSYPTLYLSMYSSLCVLFYPHPVCLCIPHYVCFCSPLSVSLYPYVLESPTSSPPCILVQPPPCLDQWEYNLLCSVPIYWGRICILYRQLFPECVWGKVGGSLIHDWQVYKQVGVDILHFGDTVRFCSNPIYMKSLNEIICCSWWSRWQIWKELLS